jgi:hypothetical protein
MRRGAAARTVTRFLQQRRELIFSPETSAAGFRAATSCVQR